MFRKLRKTRWRHPSLRERVEQARAEIERSRAELARTAGEAGEASRLTISKLVTAWRDWAAAKPAPPLPPVIAAASRADPIEVTLNRVRAQRPPAPPVTPRQPFSATPSAASNRTPAYAAARRASSAVPGSTSAHQRIDQSETRRPPAPTTPSSTRTAPATAKAAVRAAPPPRIATPFPAKTPARRTSSDLALAGAGIALGLLCAFFPWYVFMNQDQFGVRAMRFSGERDVGPIPAGAMPAGARILADSGAPPRDVPEPPLDSFTTATLAAEQQTETPGVDDQPFPGDASGASAFRVVHVANGRAMIEDDSGLWIVERGATLPDNSRVSSIEQRDGTWVVVTSDSRVFEMQP